MRMISGGKWAPLQLIAIVVLPHAALVVIGERAYRKSAQMKIATKPSEEQQSIAACMWG
jgi:hypothetical protein